MKLYQKLSPLLLVICLLFSAAAPVSAAEGEIVVLYTNDVHTYIDNNVGEGNENGLAMFDGAVNVLDYVAEAGDSLWKIAGKYYDAGAKWGVIFEANRDTIKDPNMIQEGQRIFIPAA